MLRFEQVSSEEMHEIIRIASEMYEAEREKEMDPTQDIDEQHAVEKAADEVGLPREYLERAAQELHQRRVAAVKRTRRRRIGAFATIFAAIALWGGWEVTH